MKTIKLIVLITFCTSCSPKLIETNLYFGLSKPDGGMVSEKDWNNFKIKHISKVFKEGSSVISLNGNWYDPEAQKLITEPTYLVSYYHKNSPVLSKQIDSLRNNYKTIFNQQSVLRVDKKVTASF